MQFHTLDPAYVDSPQAREHSRLVVKLVVGFVALLWLIPLLGWGLDLSSSACGPANGSVCRASSSPRCCTPALVIWSPTRCRCLCSASRCCISTRRRPFRVLPAVYLGPGIAVWLFARDGNHVGASGLVYGSGRVRLRRRTDPARPPRDRRIAARRVPVRHAGLGRSPARGRRVVGDASRRGTDRCRDGLHAAQHRPGTACAVQLGARARPARRSRAPRRPTAICRRRAASLASCTDPCLCSRQRTIASARSIPHAHLFEVRCTVDDPEPGRPALRLPTWIPGSYLIREFARHFVDVRAEMRAGAGDRSPRRPRTRGAPRPATGPLTVVADVYAFDLSVRTAYLDATRGYFNGARYSCCPEGRDECAVRRARSSRPTARPTRDWRVRDDAAARTAPRRGLRTLSRGRTTTS